MIRLSLAAALALAPSLIAPLHAAPAPAPTPAPLPPPVRTAPPPADLPRAQFIAEMDNEFRKRDADHDGKITRAELEAWERNEAVGRALQQNRNEFLRLDVDRNGVLSPGEFAALAQAPPMVDVTPLMQRFDPNRDQTVTLVEWRGATLANFDRLDTDHDGVITAAEAAAGSAPPRTSGGR